MLSEAVVPGDDTAVSASLAAFWQPCVTWHGVSLQARNRKQVQSTLSGAWQRVPSHDDSYAFCPEIREMGAP